MCRKSFRCPSSSGGCRSGDGRDFYEVSDFGRVRSLPRKGGNNRLYGGRVLTPFVRKDGHIEVPLCRGGQRHMRAVHQLVLTAFIGPAPSGHEGCHNNGQAADCTLGNLRWDTHAANMADMVRHGTSPAGERHGNAKLTQAAVTEIRSQYAAGRAGAGPRLTHDHLAEMYGVSRTCVTLAIGGRHWRAALDHALARCRGRALRTAPRRPAKVGKGRPRQRTDYVTFAGCARFTLRRRNRRPRPLKITALSRGPAPQRILRCRRLCQRAEAKVPAQGEGPVCG